MVATTETTAGFALKLADLWIVEVCPNWKRLERDFARVKKENETSFSKPKSLRKRIKSP